MPPVGSSEVGSAPPIRWKDQRREAPPCRPGPVASTPSSVNRCQRSRLKQEDHHRWQTRQGEGSFVAPPPRPQALAWRSQLGFLLRRRDAHNIEGSSSAGRGIADQAQSAFHPETEQSTPEGLTRDTVVQSKECGENVNVPASSVHDGASVFGTAGILAVVLSQFRCMRSRVHRSRFRSQRPSSSWLSPFSGQMLTSSCLLAKHYDVLNNTDRDLCKSHQNTCIGTDPWKNPPSLSLHPTPPTSCSPRRSTVAPEHYG